MKPARIQRFDNFQRGVGGLTDVYSWGGTYRLETMACRIRTFLRNVREVNLGKRYTAFSLCLKSNKWTAVNPFA